ncbi:MAG: four helix bundle protein [Patescibacteria group bacterium]|jgi:four helix bundle protein
MRNPLGYKALLTYTQGEEIYALVKQFTAANLHPIKDSRLIGHMVDSARSVTRNISEGYGRNNSKQYYEFLGFSNGSLLELLEDSMALEKDIKGGLRIVTDRDGTLGEISKIIKLCMGEKTMLKNQMDKIEVMVGEQGLISESQRLAKLRYEEGKKAVEDEKWLQDVIKNGYDPTKDKYHKDYKGNDGKNGK